MLDAWLLAMTAPFRVPNMADVSKFQDHSEGMRGYKPNEAIRVCR